MPGPTLNSLRLRKAVKRYTGATLTVPLLMEKTGLSRDIVAGWANRHLRRIARGVYAARPYFPRAYSANSQGLPLCR